MKIAAFTAVVSAFAVIATPAVAKTYEISLTGTAYGNDDLNFFGGGSLAGHAATMKFTLNDTWSSLTSGSDSAPRVPPHYFETLQFFPERFEDDPRQYASITVNGITRPLTDNVFFGETFNTYIDYVTYTTTNYGFGTGTAAVNLIDASFIDDDGYERIDASLTGFTWVPGSIGSITKTPIVITPDNGFGSATFSYSQLMRGSYFATSGGISDFSSFIVREIPLSAAPEPGIWLMMIVGFGAAGAMMRRDREEKRRSIAT